MSGLLLDSGSPWAGFCDWFDEQLADVHILPKDTRTKGKSILFIVLTLFMMWGTVHFHFGYMNFLLACIPCGVVLALIYAEKELSKED